MPKNKNEKSIDKPEMTEKQITDAFGLEYANLCKKYNRVIKIEPHLVLTEMGTYVMKINRFIGKENPNGR